MLKKWRNNYWCGKSKNIKRGCHKWYFLNHKKINNNTWETYIIHYMYLFAKRLFFYYLWVMYTALNLRFRENKKKKNKVLLLLLLIIKNCRNLGALRRSFFFEADDSILIGGGRLGLGNKFVEPLPVSSIFFCHNVFVATVRPITQGIIFYYIIISSLNTG